MTAGPSELWVLRFPLEDVAALTPAFVERLRATEGVVDAQTETRKGRVELRLSLSREELIALFEGYGYKLYFVEGHEPAAMHEMMRLCLKRWRIGSMSTPSRSRSRRS